MDTLRSRSTLDDMNLQVASPLLNLPGELRDRIYDWALTATTDKSRQYDPQTYWARPGYSAPKTSHLALLRTCKKVYREAWHKPWTLADHSFWLTSAERAPNEAMSMNDFVVALNHVHAHQGDIEIDHVRFFAQMYALESIHRLQGFLDLQHFHPVAITITIRHTDWWFWEQDQVLSFKSCVPRQIVLPTSVRTIAMELESLERKKKQIDSVVGQMKKDWYFTRADGVVLSAQHTLVDIEGWRGSSTWDGARWIRDETVPGCLDYYVATVHWRHDSDFDPEQVPQMKDVYAATSGTERLDVQYPYLPVSLLRQAGVTDTTSAEAALSACMDWHSRRRESVRNTTQNESDEEADYDEDDDNEDLDYEYEDEDMSEDDYSD